MQRNKMKRKKGKCLITKQKHKNKLPYTLKTSPPLAPITEMVKI
jgi:hypothetical protein